MALGAFAEFDSARARSSARSAGERQKLTGAPLLGASVWSDVLDLDQGMAQRFAQTFVNSLTSRMTSCGRSRLRKCPPFLTTSSLAPGIRSKVARRSNSRDQS
jgi:hypothetical protein